MSADVRDVSTRLRLESISTIPTALTTAATTVSFIGVFGSWNFLWPSLTVGLLAHVMGAVVRALQPPVLVRALAPLAIVYLCVGWLRFGETLQWGLPLTSTWSVLVGDLRSAWDLIGDVITPVGFDTGFGTMTMVVVASVAVVTDAFAVRYGGRVEVFVPAAATVFIVAAVGTGRDRIAVASAWLATALFSAALLRRTQVHERAGTPIRPHRVGSSRWATTARAIAGMTVFATVVGTGAALLAPLLPGSTDEAWLTERLEGESRQLQPLVDVRRQLTESTPSLLFTVRSEAAAYWRLTALPDFDGSVWSVSESVLDSAAGDLTVPIGASDPGVVTVSNLQRFTIESLAGSLVPVAATPTQLRASTQSLFFEPATGSLLVGSAGLRPRDAYDIQSTMIAPRPERLFLATSDSPPNDNSLDLPDTDVMRQLRDVASSIVSSSTSPYQRALELQDYFRREFTYSLDVPALSGEDATLEFLDRRSGYCEHFASTFAIFARALGLPARVAIGFTPGDRTTSENGASLFAVSSTHAHAWPEVWFDGIGWVLFEPTPGRGAPNASYTNVPEEQAEAAPPSTTLPSTTTTTVPSTGVTPSTSLAPDSTGSQSSSPTASGSTKWPFVLLVALLAFVAAWVLLLPRIIASVIDRRAEPPVLRLWRRALALYEFERGAFPPSLSPHELARRATSRLYDDDPFIFELAERASRALFDDAVEEAVDSTMTIESNDARVRQTDDIIERGRVYIAQRRRRLSPLLRVRLRLDPVAIWRLEGGRSRR